MSNPHISLVTFSPRERISAAYECPAENLLHGPRSNFRLADAFTIMNAFCAGQSIFNSARYLVTGDTRHAWYALWYPFFGAIFDLLDGKIARWCGGGSMLGQELDSLADSVSTILVTPNVHVSSRRD